MPKKDEEKKIKELMQQTCFGSISFCCGLEKTCSIRSKTLKDLWLTEKDFIKLKNKFDENLIELLGHK